MLGTDEVIRFENVYKLFTTADSRELTVLEDISFSVKKNEFATIIGSSGCGKTTALRLCAGLTTPTRGEIYCNGKKVMALNKEVGFITQDSNLMPWFTLIQNVEFPLEVRGVPKSERRKRAREILKMVGLSGFEDYYPGQLSGGMQKRGAIARTLVYSPEVIFMDEPFGSLDAQTKIILQNELQEIWLRDRKTILFITHDLTEAIILSDKVVLLTARPGRIKKIFSINLPRPRNVFEVHSTPGFTDIYHEVWGYFRSEMTKME